MATSLEAVAVFGTWTWKEDSSQPCLEFVSNIASLDKQDRRRRAKANDVRDLRDRASAGGSRPAGNKLHTFSPAAREHSEQTTVSLSHIKNVALEIMSEDNKIPVHFEMLYRKERFDDFLLHLLHYFKCFFNKISMDNKRNLMYIEPCMGEKLAYAQVCDRLRHAQKLLGGAYSLLLLGLDLEEQHHLACGRSKVSKTYTDRSLFETFYHFCTVFVWITFYRTELDRIRHEVGRLLRSDTFNPALRVKAKPADAREADLNTDADKEHAGKGQKRPGQDKMAAMHYQRRPAIKSIVNQRSPAIVSILPSPKEEANWLFRRPHEKMEKSSFYAMRDAEVQFYTETHFWDEMLHVSTLKVGILGQPSRQFDAATLSPLAAGTDDQANQGHNRQHSPISDHGDNESETDRHPDAALSRQATALSRATTDVAITDDDS
ncbi:hypothetical protein BsWGS_14530 [Bradybaena similaris]